MFSLYGFNPSAYPDPQLSNQPVEEDDSTSASDQRALFGSVKVGLTSALSIIGGARISRDSLSAVDVVRVDSFTGSDSARFDEPTKAVPYGGVIYDLSQNFSTYASYAEVYESNGLNVRSANGSFLPPVDSDNLEMGVKGAWRDNTLNSTLAVFGIEQKAIAVEDIAAVEANRSQSNGCCFTTSGVIGSKGADLELNGQLTPGWLVGSGYTYNEVYGNQSAAVAGFTPRHLFKLWTSKDLAGIMRGWTVGGRIEAQSAISTPYVPCPSYPQLDCLGELASPLFKTVQGSQAIVGLHASYAIDSHWRIALNANNIFDRVYYQTLGTPYDADWYGEPRAFTLRIDAKY
jgi:outer membrane receptor for ferric coprogen and ferric-rhodotorulic acid